MLVLNYVANSFFSSNYWAIALLQLFVYCSYLTIEDVVIYLSMQLFNLLGYCSYCKLLHADRVVIFLFNLLDCCTIVKCLSTVAIELMQLI